MSATLTIHALFAAIKNQSEGCLKIPSHRGSGLHSAGRNALAGEMSHCGETQGYTH
jgi:hypothetical protein